MRVPSAQASVLELGCGTGRIALPLGRAGVSLVGIELLTIDARIVIASVDTYLRFAEATHRLDLQAVGGKDLPETMEAMRQAPTRGITKGVITGVKDVVKGR